MMLLFHALVAAFAAVVVDDDDVAVVDDVSWSQKNVYEPSLVTRGGKTMKKTLNEFFGNQKKQRGSQHSFKKDLR
jgi:hypothetical protein